MNKYEFYKNTHLDWVPEIPENWSLIRSKFMFRNKSIKNCPDEELLSVTQKNGVVFRSESDTKVWNPTEDVLGYKLIEPGDFVISLRSFEGGLELSKVKGIVSPAYTVLEKTRKIDDRYFWWLMKSHQFIIELNKHVTGIRQGKNIGWDDFSNIYLIVPPIDEQKLISRYLDKKTKQIDCLIEKIQSKIELLKEQRTSLINHCVTKGINPKVKMKDTDVKLIGKIPKHWKLQKLKHIVNKRGFIRGPFGGSLKINTFVPKGYKVYEQKNAIYNNFSLGSAYINDKKYTELKRFSIQQNDILMSCSGTIGKTSLVTGEFQKGIINQALLIIRLEFPKKTLPKYIQTIFSSSFFQEQIIDNSQGGAMKNLVGIDIFKNVKIPIPDSLEQLEIQSYIDSKCLILDKLIAKEKLKVEKLKEYRSSLISSFVTGKVRISQDMI